MSVAAPRNEPWDGRVHERWPLMAVELCGRPLQTSHFDTERLHSFAAIGSIVEAVSTARQACGWVEPPFVEVLVARPSP